jgi:hypothetical protein
MPLIWAHKGEHAGSFVEVESQAEVDAAEAEGWGQDAATTAGIHFIPAEAPTKPRASRDPDQDKSATGPMTTPDIMPKPQTAPEPAPEPPAEQPAKPARDDDKPAAADPGSDAAGKAGEYSTRHLEAETPKRGPGRPPKAG